MKSSAHHVGSDLISIQERAKIALAGQLLVQTFFAPKASIKLEAQNEIFIHISVNE